MNTVTTRIPLVVLGVEDNESDTTGMTNFTIWSELNASVLIGDNDTEEFYVFGNATGPVEHVPYSKRLETYLVPFLFAIIFIVGVIGRLLSVLQVL